MAGTPFFWDTRLAKPLTPEERRLIGMHERLHAEYDKGLSEEEKSRRLRKIEAFERGGELAVLNDEPPAPPAKKYFVHWGHMHQHVEEFADFERALGHYADHRGGPSGARLVGEGYDADCDEDGFHEVSDGLTDAERERVEAVDATRKPAARVRT